MGSAQAVASSLLYKAVVLADGPVGYWRLDDTGATALDQTANHNDGTITGSVTKGVAGALATDTNTAMNFGGVSGNRVQVPDSVSLKPARVSLEVWLQCNPLGSFPGPITKSSSGAWADGYGMYFRAGSGLAFWVNRYDGAGGGAAVYDVGYPADDLFHHYVGTWDGTTLRIYRDGVLRNSNAYSTPITYAAGLLVIGNSDPQNFVQPWPAGVDEVAIYSYALTGAQVALHYAAGRTPSVAGSRRVVASSEPYRALVLGDGPLAYWRLDDAGSVLADLTGNGHAGTLLGCTAPTPASSRNLCTVNQANFETALNAWNGDGSVAGASAAWSTFAAWLGTRSVKVTILETSGAAGVYENDLDLPAAAPGLAYVGSAWVFNPQGAAITASIKLFFFNVANALISSGGNQTFSVPNGQWIRVNTLAAVAPAGTVRVGIEVMEQPAVINDVLYFDAQQIELAALTPWQLPGGAIPAGAITDDDGALYFDGQTGRVTTAWTPPILAGQPMSLEAWVYPVGSYQQYPGILGYGQSQNPCALFLYFDGTPAFRQNSISVCCFDARDAAHPLPRNAWTHLVGTYDGANGRLYVNGALAAGPIAVASAPAISSVFISTANNSGFPGAVDEPAIYPYALTLAQIAAHYRIGRTPAAPGSRKVVLL